MGARRALDLEAIQVSVTLDVCFYQYVQSSILTQTADTFRRARPSHKWGGAYAIVSGLLESRHVHP